MRVQGLINIGEGSAEERRLEMGCFLAWNEGKCLQFSAGARPRCSKELVALWKGELIEAALT